MIWRGRENSGQEDEASQGYAAPPPVPGQQPPGQQPPGQQPGGGQPEQAVGSRVESVLDAAERAAVSIREDAQVWARNYLEESKRKADEAASARMREISDLTDSLVNRARAVAQQSDELIAAMDEAGRRVVGAAAPGRNNDVGAYPVEDNSQGPPPAPAAQPAQPAPPAAMPQQPPAQAPPPPAPAPPVQQAPPPAVQEASAPAVQQAPPPVQAPPAAAPPAPAQAPPVQAPAPAPEPAPQPSAVPDRPAALPETHQAPRPVGASSEGARLLATQMAVAGSSKDEIAWRLREEFGIQDSSGILAEIGV